MSPGSRIVVVGEAPSRSSCPECKGSGEKPCQKEGTWRYTTKALRDEPLIPEEAVWCDEHAERLERSIEHIPKRRTDVKRTLLALCMSVLASTFLWAAGPVDGPAPPPAQENMIRFLFIESSAGVVILPLSEPVVVGDRAALAQQSALAFNAERLRALSLPPDQRASRDLLLAKAEASATGGCTDCYGRTCLVSCGWGCWRAYGCSGGCSGPGCYVIRVKGD